MEQANLPQAMKERHSVRSYPEKPIDPQSVQLLRAFIDSCNRESGLHMQLVLNEPNAFSGLMAHYGKFSGVQNYIAVIGKRGSELEEKSGYFGEKVVLYAQSLGLNTCWVAMTYSKIRTAFEVRSGEKLCIVIAIGYGLTQGAPHKSKAFGDVAQVEGDVPNWFEKGIEAALLAPTAMNQQKFMFTLKDNQVSVKAGMGFYAKIDLGIVKYHFEVGAGETGWEWGA